MRCSTRSCSCPRARRRTRRSRGHGGCGTGCRCWRLCRAAGRAARLRDGSPGPPGGCRSSSPCSSLIAMRLPWRIAAMRGAEPIGPYARMAAATPSIRRGLSSPKAPARTRAASDRSSIQTRCARIISGAAANAQVRTEAACQRGRTERSRSSTPGDMGLALVGDRRRPYGSPARAASPEPSQHTLDLNGDVGLLPRSHL